MKIPPCFDLLSFALRRGNMLLVPHHPFFPVLPKPGAGFPLCFVCRTADGTHPGTFVPGMGRVPAPLIDLSFGGSARLLVPLPYLHTAGPPRKEAAGYSGAII